MIDLTVQEEVRRRNIQRCREKGITLPTFSQMERPETIPENIKEKLRKTDLNAVDPVNLYRIGWHNTKDPEKGPFGDVACIELPKSLTGVNARIFCLVGSSFPTKAHKVGATYACLAPAVVTGAFDIEKQTSVWPSTGNYCRGGAYNAALLGCESIAILPKTMSRERFEWLEKITGRIIATGGHKSNMKAIFEACERLQEEEGDRMVVFNQFERFENYLWHYRVTGGAVLDMLDSHHIDRSCLKGFIAGTGSGGTIAAGDRLKDEIPTMKIAAGEALQCPTMLNNGFGSHRIEGMGDKHIPWIHHVRNTDMVTEIDDRHCIDLFRLFHSEEGIRFLRDTSLDQTMIDNLSLFGISGIANTLGAIKMAKYYEMGKDDVICTVLTDDADLYLSRIENEAPLTYVEAAQIYAADLLHQTIDNTKELNYYERKGIHNLKYTTWVEKRDKTAEELSDQWFSPDYWKGIPAVADELDKMIEKFNREIEGE